MRPVLLEGRALHIFPCRADKRPISPHGYKDAVADPAGQARLFAAHPGQLIGVATGVISGIDVLDIDSRRGGDVWFHQHRDRLPVTRTHETRNGGWHLIFRHTPGLPNTTDRIAPGVETISDGRHVIWWPEHGYRVLCEGPVAVFPRWLLDELVTRVIRRAALVPRGGAPLLIEAKRLPRDLYFQTLKLIPPSNSIRPRDQRRVCGWLSLVVHAEKGTRNDRLFWAACRFGEFEGRVTKDIAEQLLFAAACVCGLVQDDGQQSALATIASGLQTGAASNGAPPVDFIDGAA
jgi:hypothetical protein